MIVTDALYDVQVVVWFVETLASCHTVFMAYTCYLGSNYSVQFTARFWFQTLGQIHSPLSPP